MHELSYVTHLVDLALKTARKNHAKTVKSITVEVGEMTGVEPYYLKYYYPQVVEGTILNGAELITEQVPVLVSCSPCGGEYQPSRDNKYLCPHCGSPKGRILKGKEVLLKDMEIEI